MKCTTAQFSSIWEKQQQSNIEKDYTYLRGRRLRFLGSPFLFQYRRDGIKKMKSWPLQAPTSTKQILNHNLLNKSIASRL